MLTKCKLLDIIYKLTKNVFVFAASISNENLADNLVALEYRSLKTEQSNTTKNVQGSSINF